MRLAQFGSGDRSAKIRTYNFPQGRLTDHRINLTLYKLGQIMDGDLGDVIQGLLAAQAAEQLAQLRSSGVILRPRRPRLLQHLAQLRPRPVLMPARRCRRPWPCCR